MPYWPCAGRCCTPCTVGHRAACLAGDHQDISNMINASTKHLLPRRPRPPIIASSRHHHLCPSAVGKTLYSKQVLYCPGGVLRYLSAELSLTAKDNLATKGNLRRDRGEHSDSLGKGWRRSVFPNAAKRSALTKTHGEIGVWTALLRMLVWEIFPFGDT